MKNQPNLSSTAFLIADAARAAMLMALADGRARPANELAFAAGVTAQTASSHLGKLLDGGLLAVEKQGRHRYYRLADPHIAVVLEGLAAISGNRVIRHKPLGREAEKLRFARCCYDHLAGRVGVAILQKLIAQGYLVAGADRTLDVTAAGSTWFADMGIDIGAVKPGRHGIARECLDWTERHHHLAGPLGAQFMTLLCSRDWLRRTASSRAVQVTPDGWAGLKRLFGLTPALLESPSPLALPLPDERHRVHSSQPQS
jgi:DNA-binding transcriptional ArsR family regulator